MVEQKAYLLTENLDQLSNLNMILVLVLLLLIDTCSNCFNLNPISIVGIVLHYLELIKLQLKQKALVLHKLLKYFNGTIILTFFAPRATVLFAVFCLNVNEALLLLAA